MSLRDDRQLEFANVWLENGEYGILNLCPRFGKIRTSFNILKKFPKDCSVFIAYPDLRIKKSWEDEFKLLGYTNDNITYSTHLSLHKYVTNVYNIIIIDEIHLLSDAEIEAVKELTSYNKTVLGLTGTLSRYTEINLGKKLGLVVLAEYPIEEAIKEGVIADYEITVFKIPLDNTVRTRYSKGWFSERVRFKQLSYTIDKMVENKKDPKFMRIARMRIIQNSIAKLNKTKELISQHPNDRILVFCGITKIADNIGIPSYHSKSSEKNLFQDFLDGKGNHLAVIKMGNTGTTYAPLDRVIINYFSSSSEDMAQRINRCMSYEYNNPEKKSKIYIVCSNEETEERWLKRALEFFDKEKITYIFEDE